MQEAAIPKDEKARLEALYRYNILDTKDEEAFDELTQLASTLCETPIALISLVDPKRQWFKSRVGLDAKETPRNIAFCSHAIHERDIFEIPDTLKDNRFFDNPLVTGPPHIRFYAGTQLVTPQGHAIGTLCTISDKPKRLSADQKRALKILGNAVISQLELRLKNAELSKANERKTEFLSDISHELRTPLNAIISLSQLMIEQGDDFHLPDKFKQHLMHIDFSGKRLLSLVNSVLDLSKIEAGKMELHPSLIDTKDFFSSIHGMMKATADAAQVGFNVNVAQTLPAQIYIDEVKLSQIIMNLLSNAIKFTPKGNLVSLAVTSESDVLTIQVCDQGVGIAQKDLPLLFDKFKQVSIHRTIEGTGLGLPITKLLIELMGGNIDIQSQVGKGTQASVTLPVEPVLMCNYEHKPARPKINKQAKILVVEDNLINQEVAKAVFESLSLNMEFADDGEQGVEKAKGNHYDIIFMDLHLPGISGWDAAEQIHKYNKDIPIVALSADAFSNAPDKYKSKGIVDFLTKPINKVHLTRVLEKIIPAG
ncbi:hybrid sensor histidine kinase/response regulator [Alteromonas sediminis]|uniref:histidine kinase n=1 Tax=Alteromonas sediminis TaxID=2259342 RepID=A0A3N5Y0A9_9ALTE|nr:GAF domain-containing hybrid sensor histidine kinase/response regulator [Alteromonas sediminis]RPJ65896.1 hybrid sensor histidine kinase/response regulator [Alteromonas sediminis]